MDQTDIAEEKLLYESYWMCDVSPIEPKIYHFKQEI